MIVSLTGFGTIYNPEMRRLHLGLQDQFLLEIENLTTGVLPLNRALAASPAHCPHSASNGLTT